MKNRSNLFFLYNELMNPVVYHELMHLPFEFICFGTTDGRMYDHYYNHSTFIVPLGKQKKWGNSKVYGALFLCKEFEFYADLLDAYNACSLTKLRRNHIKDIHHRERVDVTPIYFDTLDDLSRLKYTEGVPLSATTYIGNVNHPKINQRFVTEKNYRIVDGIDKKNFTKLFRRVNE